MDRLNALPVRWTRASSNEAGGSTDTLLVASAAGPSVSSQTAARIAQELEKAQHRQVTVTDIRAPGKGDGRGMTSFYLRTTGPPRTAFARPRSVSPWRP